MIGAILVTILSVVILATVIFSHGPKGQTFTLNFLALPSGSGIGTIAKAAVYGFLAFAGFEGAAALGEETSDPKTQIPRAIKTAVVVVGAFYLLTAAAQSLGYGATPTGAKALRRRPALLAISATATSAKWYADMLDLMATISLFAISLGVASGAARIMYAQARDGAGKATGSPACRATASPSAALVIVLVIFALALVGQQLAGIAGDQRDLLPAADRNGADPRRLRDGHGRRDPLPVLQGRAKAPVWQIVIPLLGGAFVVYTIIRNTVVNQAGDLRAPAVDRAGLPGDRPCRGDDRARPGPAGEGRAGGAGWRRDPDRRSAADAGPARPRVQPRPDRGGDRSGGRTPAPMSWCCPS